MRVTRYVLKNCGSKRSDDQAVSMLLITQKEIYLLATPYC